MANTNELKPCPFCGGEAYTRERTCDKDTTYNPNDRAYPVVRCSKCFTTVAGKDWTGVSTAIEVWNKRADSTQPADAALAEMEARKDSAYLERNQVVAALAKCFPSVVAKTAIEGWSEDWHGCVYIELPTGQASWHFHDSQAYLFADIPRGEAVWDGHSTEEKYLRVAALRARAVPAPSVCPMCHGDTCHPQCQQAYNERQTGKPAPEGMVMDAARYQWLKASKPIHDGAPFIARNFGASFSMWTGEDADRVIDEAIAAAKVKP